MRSSGGEDLPENNDTGKRVERKDLGELSSHPVGRSSPWTNCPSRFNGGSEFLKKKLRRGGKGVSAESILVRKRRGRGFGHKIR